MGPWVRLTTTSRSRSPSCAVVPTSSPSSMTWPAGSPRCTTPARCSTRWPGRPAGCSGVDVAYIMLLRADRLRIEVVDGAMGSAMRGIELESGQGLGGQVLATGRPLWSERYLEDTGFPHGDGTERPR